MKKLLVICGPTATGKTALGIKLAKSAFGGDGEIISADSRQVYEGMDIGTGKDLPKFTIYNLQLTINEKKAGYYLFDGVPVWMLDVVEPDIRFTVADYYDLAWKVIKDIWSRGKLPIVVGGTGFYIGTLTEGLGTLGIEPDWLMRRELQSFKVSELQGLLEKVDMEKLGKMNQSDKNNPRRLIRALEVVLHGKRNGVRQKAVLPEFDPLFIGLAAPLKEIYERIDVRIENQLRQGAEKEVKGLIKKGYSWDLPSMTAMGYCEWKDYFEDKRTKEEIVAKWKSDEHGYAKRQMTWFKKALRQIRQAHCKQAQGYWFDITKDNWQERVEKLVYGWYS